MKLFLLGLVVTSTCLVEANPHAKRLYDDLLSNYNRLIRPVTNNTEKLTVRLGLKLSQLIDVDLKNQIMTTNVWVEQKWMDYKLQWDPDDYGGVDMLYVPSQHIWLPDIVLFNNADGKYEVTLMTKASLKYTGEVEWKPPAIYKSSCKINVEWFPFDEQNCDMKFGSWTYNGNQLDLKHVDQVKGSNVVMIGIDLTEFYMSVEWDILAVPATRNEEYYIPQSSKVANMEVDAEGNVIKKDGDDDDDDENEDLLGLDGPRRKKKQRGGERSDVASLDQQLEEEDEDDENNRYDGQLLTDITFYMTLRRKTLFYTVNLIIPCVGISFLTVLVFYLPSDSGEKVTLCISILLSLTVFFLLLAEIIPPTSLAVPLLGKYLLFTMILVTLSICVTVTILNIHFRSPTTHRMSPWVRQVFINVMPRILFMQRPHYIPRYSAEPPPSKKAAAAAAAATAAAAAQAPEEMQLSINEDDSCQSNVHIRNKPNGHLGSDKWDDDYDNLSNSCTSHCHHHPHLQQQRSHTLPHTFSHGHGHGHGHHQRGGNRPLNGQCNATGPRAGAGAGASPHHRGTNGAVRGQGQGHGQGRRSSEQQQQQQQRERKPPLSQVGRALKGVEFIAQHIKKADKDTEVIEDWKFIAMVLDRLFLWLFTLACIAGFVGIILRAPSHYDMRKPIDDKLSEIPKYTVTV